MATDRLTRFVALAFSAIALASCASASPPRLEIDAEPAPLPTAELAEVDAASFQGIVAGLRGEPVVVNVWASWCGPCRVEAPLLDRAAAANDDVRFIGIASRDEVSGARRFLRRYDIDYPNLFDADGSVRRLLRLRGFPTTYTFDRQGRLVSADVGGISEQTLAARIADARRS